MWDETADEQAFFCGVERSEDRVDGGRCGPYVDEHDLKVGVMRAESDAGDGVEGARETTEGA